MIKYFCDRCRKEVDEFSYKNIHYIENAYDTNEKKHMLCPDCFNDFKNFLNQSKDFIEKPIRFA